MNNNGKLSLAFFTIALLAISGASTVKSAAEKRYEAIVADIREFELTDEFTVLDRAALSVVRHDLSRTMTRVNVEVPEAIATSLLSIHKEGQPEMPLLRTEFDSLFEVHIAKPCDKALEINSRFVRCFEQNPEIDDYEHRHSSMFLQHFSQVAKFCLIQSERLQIKEAAFAILAEIDA